MTRRILVTGANGFIGGRLSTLAQEQGLEVRTLTRRDWPGEPFVPVTERFLGWLPHGCPATAFEGITSVVHCAALTSVGSDEEARAINVAGTAALAEAAIQAGAKRFVFVSSQSARANAAAAYGRTKHEAEEALASLAGRLSISVVRPGLVCGAASRGLYARMAALVRRLPVVPLLGGGRALVQPLHVDDLCRALLRLATGEVEASKPLCLGDPQGLPLAELLDEIARAETGKPRPRLPLPVAPFLAVTTVAEALGLTLPVSSTNLKGLKAVERMDTSADMARLGVPVRPVREIVERSVAAVAAEPKEAPLASRSAGVVLVGAGRIGLAHAVTASRRHGSCLVAMVDLNPKATGLLAGLGVRAKATKSIDEVLAGRGAARLDAAIVATPASSHLPLAERCVGAGLATLVEKPLALRAEDLPAWERLAASPGGDRVLVGYLTPRAPHAAAALARLAAGGYGKPSEYLGLTLLSFVEGPGSKRWETDPRRSGGGVLANAAGHVLSLATTAFGEATEVRSTLQRRWSTEVEDSACVELEHAGGARGRCLASWSIPGFSRQENVLVVATSRGTLVLANDCACFEPLDGGAPEILHAIDFDVGFSLFPEYAGGVPAEHADLARMIRGGPASAEGAMTLAKALAVERVLQAAYRVREDGPFTPSTTSPEMGRAAAGTLRDDLLLDARESDVDEVAATLRAEPGRRVVLSASLASALHREGLLDERVRLTVPDFTRQARMLASGRALDLLRDMGPSGVAGAVLATAPAIARERGVTFWAAAEALLAASLAAVPDSFAGVLLVHPYLVDLALAVERPDRVRRFVEQCRRRAPRARVGVQSNLAADVARLDVVGTRLDVVHVLSSPAARDVARAVALVRSLWKDAEIVAEVGPAMPLVQRAAAAAPEPWLHGADGLLVGGAADEALARGRARRLESAWSGAFPGLPLPRVLA